MGGGISVSVARGGNKTRAADPVLEVTFFFLGVFAGVGSMEAVKVVCVKAVLECEFEFGFDGASADISMEDLCLAVCNV